MEGLALEWLSLLLRLLHVVTAIAWIGASFYFVWLDNSLAPPPADKRERGIQGDLWAFHGGGIYEVAKYQLAPPVMPEKLHWFKWEAYSTWISGALLLMAVYYLRAELYLVGADKWLTTAAAAVAGSGLFIAAGVAVYEVLLRALARRRPALMVSLLTLWVVASCWLAVQLFSDRAAFLHVGAMLASIMAANVLVGIIPAQKRFMQALATGAEPDRLPMQLAKLRSIHNNYLTLPVLLAMISNHYSFLYGHALNWLLLAAGMAIAAYTRHFFNLRHRHSVRPHILWFAAGATLILALFTAWPLNRGDGPAVLAATDAEFTLIKVHCGSCHATQPTQPGFVAAPKGLTLETPAQLQAVRTQAAAALASGYMPLGNITGLTDAERARLLAWLQ